MFKNPEFANTNTELFTAAQNYVQAVEDSINSEDYYTIYNGEKKHYTDLVDLDSLVRYLMLNEFYWNTETMKKSTYMYKDLGGKLFIGPVWDMDWTSNSQIRCRGDQQLPGMDGRDKVGRSTGKFLV